jgi:hypothetical protein
MFHRGVESTIIDSHVPNVWKWRFRIGSVIKTGKTETKLRGLAERRAQFEIDSALKAAASEQTMTKLHARGS